VYYRTVDDNLELLAQSETKLKDLQQIYDLIERKFKVKQLGNLAAMLKDAIWVGKGGIQKDHQFQVANGILGEIVLSDAYADVVDRHNLVAVFGRLVKGKVVEAILLNKDGAAAALKSINSANP
jgi:hypothetical protein